MNYKKLFVGLAVVALIFGITAVSAKAATIEELLAQIALLQQQLNQMQGGGGGGSAPMPPLTVGSTGEGVRSLQQWLNANGFTVAASGPGSAGMESTYFGALTQAAVARFQVANGITPAAGYYGNITYNAILSMGGDSGGGGGGSGKAQCADGIDNDSDGKIDGYDADCSSIDDTDESAGSGGGSGQADGNLVAATVSLESSPADGTDVKIGDSNMQIARWKVRASNDNGILRQVTIETTNRSWLYWRAARIKIDGVTVGEKTGLSSADFNEITAGSLYQLLFTGLNVKLPVNTDVYLVLEVDAVTDTSRIAASALVVRHPSTGLVVADEDDGYTLSTGVTSNRTWDFVAASTGNAVPSRSLAEPGTRWVKVSEQTTTPKVTMGVYEIKAEGRDIEINKFVVGVKSGGEDENTMMTAFDLYEGSCPTDGDTTSCTLIAGGSDDGESAASSTVSFTNLTVPILSGTSKTFTVKALFADEDDFTAAIHSAASTTAYAAASTIGGVDKPNFNTITVSGSNVTSGDAHAILVAPTISSAVMNFSSPTAGKEYLGTISGSFNITANGGAIYISKTPALAFATTTTTSTSTAQGTEGRGITSFAANDNFTGQDTSTYFQILNGQTRTLKFEGALSNLGGTSADNHQFRITNLYFDDDTTDLNEFFFDITFPSMSAFDKRTYLTLTDISQ